MNPKFTEKPKVEVIESTSTEEHDLFTIISHNGEYLIGVGNKIVTKHRFATREDAVAYIDSKPWELILNVTSVMLTNLIENDVIFVKSDKK